VDWKLPSRPDDDNLALSNGIRQLRVVAMGAQPLDRTALIATIHDRAPTDDPLALLDAAMAVAAEAGEAAEAAVDHYVAAARATGLSWTAIGERLGVSKQAARQRFSSRLGISGGPVAEPAPLAPRLISCLEAAQAAADAEDSVPGTQHLLLGLLHVGVAANVLDRLGVTRDKVREASGRLFESTGGDASGPRLVGDGEAETTVAGARRFATNRGQNLARTEHLLFVLALDPGSSARRVLNDLGVEPARVKKELNDLIPPPPRPGRRGRRIGKGDHGTRACSFCGCTDPHRAMVTGPGIRICGECVALSAGILRSSQQQDMAASGRRDGGRLLG
jgi:Clp amino terminal domain, pathogenicity island component/ClpX C4-type zinc finger